MTETSARDPARPADSTERAEALGGFLVDRARLATEVRRLSKVDDARAAWSIARQWLVIALAIGLALWSQHWAVWIAAGIVCATRQHALLVLMHDATHHRLFSTRRLNELLSDVFCAFPVGFSTQLYRSQHAEHHRYVNTDRDPYWVGIKRQPDWTFPKTRGQILKLFAKDLLGLHLVRMFLYISLWSPWPRVLGLAKENPLTRRERLRWVLWVAVVAAGLTVTRAWLPCLLLWVLPSLTVLAFLFRVRGVAEHVGLPSSHELNTSRHVDATLLERWSISPLNVNHHLAHHLFPSVPQYHLPELHQLLLLDETFRQHAHCIKTYLGTEGGLMGELTLSGEASTAAPTPAST